MSYDEEKYYANIEELICDDFYKLGVDIEDIINDIVREAAEFEKDNILSNEINKYSVALEPEQSQPSGTINLSKIPNLYIFASHLFDGSGGLSYSN